MDDTTHAAAEPSPLPEPPPVSSSAPTDTAVPGATANQTTAPGAPLVGTDGAAALPPAPPEGSRLSLALSEDQRTLLATYTPPANADTPGPKLQPADVHALVKAQGFDALWQNDPGIQQLIQQVPGAKQPLTIAIGEKRDARCVVQVSKDKMSASMTLVPPQGGANLTLDQVTAALNEKGVRAGLLEDAIAAAVEAGVATNVQVAQGKPCINGDNTKFEQLVPDMVERHPHIDEHGMADYRDLGDLVVVKTGTPLLRRIPPTEGEEGFDVGGNALRPKPGISWPFAPGLKGVETDANDPDLLVASVTGQPVMVSRGVKVDPNFVLKQVDLSTGNVTFDGAIQIKGDVTDGMKVTCTGDVLIGGAVLAGEIETTGNVVIKGGVIGHSEYNGKASGSTSWFSAKVVAQGHIHAKYAENAYLRSEANIELDDYAMHTEIAALGHIIIGKPGGKKGKFIGGHARATVSIRVAESGSDTGPPTVLQAGYNPALTKELFLLDQRTAKHETEVANLQKIIDFVTAHPERNKDDLAGRATVTQEMHQSELLDIEAQRANLKEAMHLADDAHIAIEYVIHGGTEVCLGGKVWKTADRREKAVFRINSDGGLTLGS
ncbi:MAG: FapA family protein [Burkholderiales bacterium]|nr:FapA family protein [Burkholderiales bacterium]